MRNLLDKLTPKTPMGQRMLMLAVVIAVGIAAFLCGRRQQVVAGDPSPDILGTLRKNGSAQNGGRIVAMLYKDVPVPREEPAEYLIARFGPERLEFMINRKIV